MLPEWMTQTDDFVPPRTGGTFAVQTIRSIGQMMEKISVQRGHEKNVIFSPVTKLIGLVLFLLLLSVTRQRLVVLFAAAVVLLYLCLWPARDMATVLKSGGIAAVFSFVLQLPAMLLNKTGSANQLMIVAKVFIGMMVVTIFNHTTQWNHITGALRRLHVPGIFVFTFDITLKYIVLCGGLIRDLLTAYLLRNVGKNKDQYSSIGGVMGVTFIRSAKMSREMYEAMCCRGFTDDYDAG